MWSFAFYGKKVGFYQLARCHQNSSIIQVGENPDDLRIPQGIPGEKAADLTYSMLVTLTSMGAELQSQNHVDVCYRKTFGLGP